MADKSISLQELEKRYKVNDFFIYICKLYLEVSYRDALEAFRLMREPDQRAFMKELNYCTFKDIGDDGPWQMDFLAYIIDNVQLK